MVIKAKVWRSGCHAREGFSDLKSEDRVRGKIQMTTNQGRRKRRFPGRTQLVRNGKELFVQTGWLVTLHPAYSRRTA